MTVVLCANRACDLPRLEGEACQYKSTDGRVSEGTGAPRGFRVVHTSTFV